VWRGPGGALPPQLRGGLCKRPLGQGKGNFDRACSRGYLLLTFGAARSRTGVPPA
jgi:hypothetical protein